MLVHPVNPLLQVIKQTPAVVLAMPHSMMTFLALDSMTIFTQSTGKEILPVIGLDIGQYLYFYIDVLTKITVFNNSNLPNYFKY